MQFVLHINLTFYHLAVLEFWFPKLAQFWKIGEASIAESTESCLIIIPKYLFLSTYFRKIYVNFMFCLLHKGSLNSVPIIFQSLLLKDNLDI